MSLLNDKWIEVFRAGDYGDKGSYSEADLDKMVRNFQPSQHEPPLTIGHPEHDAPAWGWVQALKRLGNTLFAKFKDVQPQFEELFRSGQFRKRSISLYTTPDGPMLRHVGFLGAMPPEVKGLADVKFREGQFQAIEFDEESEMENEELKGLRKAIRKLTEFFERSGARSDAAPDFKKELTEALKPIEQRFSDLEKKLNDEKSAREAAAATTSTASQTAFAEKQMQRIKDKQRWIPAFDKMGLPQIFAELSKSPTKVAFGEGDKKQEKPLAEVFADFMCALPKLVPAGELAPSAAQDPKVVPIRFNEPTDKHVVVDQTSISMAEAATKLAAEKKITYGDALREVRRSGQFAPDGGAAAGAV